MRTLTLSVLALLGLNLAACQFAIPVGGYGMPDDDSGMPDDDDDDSAVESDDYTLVFTVTSSGASFLDFSYGYCSNIEQPESCDDWNQSDVDDVVGPTVVSNEIVVSNSGSGRLNSTYTNEAGAEVGWFCTLGTDADGNTVPQLTGTATVAVNGVDLGDEFVYGVLYGNGCSGGFSVTEIVEAYLDAIE